MIGIIAIIWKNFFNGTFVLARVNAKINPTAAPKTAVSAPIIMLFKKALRKYQEETISLYSLSENLPPGIMLVIITFIRGYIIKTVNDRRIKTTTPNKRGSLVIIRICRLLCFSQDSFTITSFKTGGLLQDPLW